MLNFSLGICTSFLRLDSLPSTPLLTRTLKALRTSTFDEILKEKNVALYKQKSNLR